MSTTREPWKLASLAELLALAARMEQEAIDGYLDLSRRMESLERPDLARVFDTLVAEEQGHLSKVDEWRQGLGFSTPTQAPENPNELFEDEGVGIVSPDLLSAYRAFSMAVRNEERAFVFWTYVSAHAHSEEIREAAERMAREELGHVATLRRERRRAFHTERGLNIDVTIDSLPDLERKLKHHLDTQAASETEAGKETALRSFSRQSELRLASLVEAPLEGPASPASFPRSALGSPLALGELLVDYYLNLGSQAKQDIDASRGRAFAAELIHCLATLRDQPPPKLA
ncbi:ferritin family protein [Rhizobium sp. 16-488-2a]|nr:ferritin family protein [Rhizobium sp. 16-488-2b]MBO9177480.1 ferritin family protein [Rhizobium sp. 16-488-2a]